jgi:hypothetical protein
MIGSDAFTNGIAICEEFSRHTYGDKENQSMLVNVSHDWVNSLINRMSRIGFKLITKIEMDMTTTVVFSLVKLKKSA